MSYTLNKTSKPSRAPESQNPTKPLRFITSAAMAMEFWGVEVKAGEPFKVESEEGILLHLSQASLGEVKKDKAESVVVYVNIDGKKLVIGTLSSDKCPQIAYDLVFEKDFELSHTGKGSVHFLGYRAEMDDQSEEDDFDMNTSSGSEEESEDEEVLVPTPANGKPEPEAAKSKVAEKAKAAKPETSKGKEVKPEDDSEDTSDEDDDDSKEDDSDDEDMVDGESGDDEDDDDEESSEEEAEPTPENAKKNKKRAAESAAKTPAAEKKAKLVTPQKSGGDGKKGNAHTATPHPSKGGKANAKQSPKSASQVSCKACSKTFNSDGALQSHTKAKHSESK